MTNETTLSERSLAERMAASDAQNARNQFVGNLRALASSLLEEAQYIEGGEWPVMSDLEVRGRYLDAKAADLRNIIQAHENLARRPQ